MKDRRRNKGVSRLSRGSRPKDSTWWFGRFLASGQHGFVSVLVDYHTWQSEGRRRLLMVIKQSRALSPRKSQAGRIYSCHYLHAMNAWEYPVVGPRRRKDVQHCGLSETGNSFPPISPGSSIKWAVGYTQTPCCIASPFPRSRNPNPCPC